MCKNLLENSDAADKGKLLSLTVNSVYNSEYCKYKTKYTYSTAENTADYPACNRNNADNTGNYACNCLKNEEHKSLICVVACKL